MDKLDKYIKFDTAEEDENSVFISYQSKSFSKIVELSNFLEDHGVKTWYAPRNIQFGEKWALEISKAISRCKALLLIFTTEADNSEQVYREVSLADSFHRPILWINLDLSKPKNLIYYLNSIQWYSSNSYDLLAEILKDSDVAGALKRAERGVEINQTVSAPFENWAKGIFAFDTAEEAAECVARAYFLQAQKVKNRLLLLPTGRSAKKIFYEMIKIAPELKAPFGKNYLMNDTETMGVSLTDKTSRFHSVSQNLFSVLKGLKRSPKEKYIKPFGMNGSLKSPEEFAREVIQKYPISAYGISVSPFMEIIGYCNGKHGEEIVNDGPRIIEVTKDTRQYIDNRQKTDAIYSVGLGSALSADLLMILAFDDNPQTSDSGEVETSKSFAIKRLFYGETSFDVPLTQLRRHSNAFVVVTKAIARRAGIIDYATIDQTPREGAEWMVGKD